MELATDSAAQLNGQRRCGRHKRIAALSGQVLWLAQDEPRAVQSLSEREWAQRLALLEEIDLV
jgi:hypothetical protein